MFDDPYPRDTHARTRARLVRHGPTPRVIALNAFEWISLSLHHALWPIIGATLALALASRADLVLLKLLLLAPLSYLLVIRPLLRGAQATRHQVRQHRSATRIWGG